MGTRSPGPTIKIAYTRVRMPVIETVARILVSGQTENNLPPVIAELVCALVNQDPSVSYPYIRIDSGEIRRNIGHDQLRGQRIAPHRDSGAGMRFDLQRIRLGPTRGKRSIRGVRALCMDGGQGEARHPGQGSSGEHPSAPWHHTRTGRHARSLPPGILGLLRKSGGRDGGK